MTDQQAISIINNIVYTSINSLKYRKEHGDVIRVEEYMMPEALRIVMNLASKVLVKDTINTIINKDKGE